MRRVTIIALALAAAGSIGTLPARGAHINGWHDITFTAGVSCHHFCPYWLELANIDLDGNGKEDVFFQACTNPDGTADMLASVPGIPHGKGVTYDDVVVGPAPAGTKLLEAEIFPTVDWDGFICEWKTGNVGGVELATLANILLENCDNLIGPNNPVPIGCVEKGNIEAAPGKRYIIRAYNFADTATATGRYRFRSA